jgi:hypothetical protein
VQHNRPALFHLIAPTGLKNNPNSTTPSATPKILAHVILSPGSKNAITNPKAGIVACRTAASPEEMYCSPQNNNP